MRRHARGTGTDQLFPPAEVKSISRETTFDTDTRDSSLLKATLSYLVQRVGSSLRQQHKQARTVTLKIRFADFTTITRRQSLEQASSSDQVLLNSGLELLEKLSFYVKQPVRLIGIGVSHLVEPGTQLDMLDPSVLARERLSRVIDRIRKKYGFRAILPGRTLPLKDIFSEDDDGYTLHTPSLSR